MSIWPRWFRHSRLESEMRDELCFHIEEQTRANIAAGMSLEEARRQASLKFGALEGVKEDVREQCRGFWLETLRSDVRYATRMLSKSQAFTIVAGLTLALGIGASTAIFSVVNGVLLNPLPFPQSDQLVTLAESKPNFATGSISYPNFRDWQKNNRTFSGMAISRSISFNMTGIGDAEQVKAELLSSDYFSLLGVKPVIGRMFAPSEDEVGAAPVAMISEGLWKRKFGSLPEVLGRSITLDGGRFTVVGVIPTGFDLTVRSFRDSDVYVPIGQWKNNFLLKRAAGLGIHGIGRLKSGVSIEQARADMDSLTSNLAATYPDDDKGIGAAVFPMKQDMVGSVQPLLLLLLGAVCCVQLIACVNVANLTLARSTARSREFAIRTALGAGSGRLIRQLLTESILLGVAGNALGLLLAAWGTRLALQNLPVALPRAAAVGLDARVLSFSIAVSVASGILFGLAPALKARKQNTQNSLKETGRSALGAQHRAQSIFVVTEMALAIVLLAGAGLMIRSLARLWSQNPGFNPRDVVTINLSPPPSLMNTSAESVRAFSRELNRRFADTSGVEAVSLTWAALPMGSDDEDLFWLDGQPKPASQNEMNWAVKYVVEPDYLKVMQIPLRSGRFFTAQDNEHAPAVAVIDETLAKKLFGNDDPIGQRIRLAENENSTVEIVGVVGHVNQWGLASDVKNLQAQLYLPCMQMSDGYIVLLSYGTSAVVRFAGSASDAIDSIRRTSRNMNSEQVVYGEQTMEEVMADTVIERRFSMLLLGGFAIVALMLATIGIYGVLSYLVGQRTPEIGVRIALGAQRQDVLKLVLGEGMKLTVTGAAIGVVAALAVTRLMSSLLYGVSATDPLTFVAVVVMLLLVTSAACYAPARRAMLVDPNIALRYE